MTEHQHLPPGHRGLRLGSAPTASVVVASASEQRVLDALLAWLVPACSARAIEVVVARNCSPAEYHALESLWPGVLFMPAPDGAGVQQLRFVGISAADGDIVTMIDDTAVRDDSWIADLPSAPVADPEAPEASA